MGLGELGLGEMGQNPRDCPIFWIPPIISGTGNAKNYKFCTHIHRIARNKSPLKISGQ